MIAYWKMRKKDAPSDLEYVPAPEHVSVDEILTPLIETDNIEHCNELHAGDSTKEKTEKSQMMLLWLYMIN